jgi:anti-sigma-K factor RskA
MKNATTFQAWGRRGPDRKQALNLGVFYEDNVSKKRWVLKCDDPKTLAQIDGVFVTLEPNGGSPSPSGKSCGLILHRLQESSANSRIDSIGLGQRPLAPLFGLR